MKEAAPTLTSTPTPAIPCRLWRVPDSQGRSSGSGPFIRFGAVHFSSKFISERPASVC